MKNLGDILSDKRWKPFLFALFTIGSVTSAPAIADPCKAVDDFLAKSLLVATDELRATAHESAAEASNVCAYESEGGAQTIAYERAGEEYFKAAALLLQGGHKGAAFGAAYNSYLAYVSARFCNKASMTFDDASLKRKEDASYNLASKYRDDF